MLVTKGLVAKALKGTPGGLLVPKRLSSSAWPRVDSQDVSWVTATTLGDRCDVSTRTTLFH